VSVPVEVYQHHVFVRVRVNGSEPLSFLLDSGAGATVIEKRRADALGLKSEGKLGAHGVGGSADYSLGRLDSLMVGGAVLRRQNVVIMALPDIGDVLGRPLDGILGYDFISRFVVTIDYSHQVVTLTEPGAWTAPAGARAVPLELLQNVPVVQASCDGRYAGRFVVDTGNNSTVLLHAPFVREHKLLERASRKIDMRSLGAGGQETHTMVRMDSLVIGGLTVPRPLVSLSLASTGMTGAGTQLAGNIGGWILERFTVTFDYDGRKMYLEPGPKLAEPMSIGRIGWQVARIKGHLEVVAVSEGTPAAEAGVEAGDVLLKLGDEGLGDVDVPALRRLTDQDPGTRLRFEIRRDGQTRQVELTLRELL
jgi:predicted aspartyl protease